MSTLNLGDSLILDTDYSTTEKKTGATWIDGKPIYRKTVTASFASTESFKNTAHNISNLGNVINYDALCTGSSGHTWKLPAASGSYYGVVYITSSNVTTTTTISDLYGRDVITTIYYTKTTD